MSISKQFHSVPIFQTFAGSRQKSIGAEGLVELEVSEA
jgi:hypothetical protein